MGGDRGWITVTGERRREYFDYNTTSWVFWENEERLRDTALARLSFSWLCWSGGDNASAGLPLSVQCCRSTRVDLISAAGCASTGYPSVIKCDTSSAPKNTRTTVSGCDAHGASKNHSTTNWTRPRGHKQEPGQTRPWRLTLVGHWNTKARDWVRRQREAGSPTQVRTIGLNDRVLQQLEGYSSTLCSLILMRVYQIACFYPT